MRLVAFNNVGLYVTGRADLQGDLVVNDVLHQPCVLMQGSAMADSMSASIEQGLVDGLRSPGLTGVDGQVEKVVAGIIEGMQMVFSRITCLRTGKIERTNTFSSVLNRQFGKSQRSTLKSVSKAANDQRCFYS